MSTGRGIKAGEGYIALGFERSGLLRGVRAVVKSMQAIVATVAKVGAAISVAFAPLAFGAGLAKSVTTFVRLGDQMDKMSKRTGATAEELSQMGFAAEQSGASLEDVEALFRGLARSMRGAERGLSTAKEAFADIGISVEDLAEMSPAERVEAIADGLQRIEDPTRRAGVAMDIFGRAASKMLPLLSTGAEGIANFREQADILGRTISTEQAQRAADLADRWNELKERLA